MTRSPEQRLCQRFAAMSSALGGITVTKADGEAILADLARAIAERDEVRADLDSLGGHDRRVVADLARANARIAALEGVLRDWAAGVGEGYAQEGVTLLQRTENLLATDESAARSPSPTVLERLRNFNATTGVMFGGDRHPDRCVCQNEPTPHKHYDSHAPYRCARCVECMAYQPALPARSPSAEATEGEPNMNDKKCLKCNGEGKVGFAKALTDGASAFWVNCPRCNGTGRAASAEATEGGAVSEQVCFWCGVDEAMSEYKHARFSVNFPAALDALLTALELDGWALARIVPYTQYEAIAVLERHVPAASAVPERGETP